MRRVERSRVPIAALCAVLAATALTQAAAAVASVARASSHCDYRVYAPDVHFGIVAKATFDCTTGHANSTALVEMENFANGKWQTVARTSKPLDVQAGRAYAMQVKWHPTVTCSADQSPGDETALKMRTHFVLRLPRVLTINYTTPAEPSYLPCS